MPNNTKIVKLTPTPDGQWHAVPPVQLPPHTGEWLISFELTGQNAQTVTFDKTEPIWVQTNSKPTQKAEHEQIPHWVVTGDGKELVVLNLNNNDPDQGPLQLHYRLNFDGYADLDPIIENGGSQLASPPPPPGYGLVDSNTSLAIALLIAMAVGFAIGALVFRRRAR